MTVRDTGAGDSTSGQLLGSGGSRTGDPGERIRDRREAVGFSQSELADLLKRLGVSLSRSHLANCESGRYPLRAEWAAALNALLHVDGLKLDTRGARDRRARRDLDEWVAWASALLQDDVDDRWGRTARADPARLRQPMAVWREDQLGSSPLDGLLVALRDEPAALSSSPTVWVVGCHDLDKWPAIRSVLTQLVRSGYRCRHLLPSDTEDDRSDLIKAVGSLLSCSSYEAVVVPRSAALGQDFILVGGRRGEGRSLTISLVREGCRLLGAVTSSEPEVCRLYLDSLTVHLAQAAELVQRTDRCDRVINADVSQRELEFYRELTARASSGDWTVWSTGWLPSALVPREIFQARTEERRENSTRPGDAVWDKLIEFHRQRHDALRRRLREKKPLLVLLSIEHLRAFVDEGSHHLGMSGTVADWRRFSKRDRQVVLDELVRLMDANPEVLRVRGVRGDRYARDVSRSRWEVRGGKAGYVMLQTPRRDGDGSPEDWMHLLFEDGVLIGAFKALFDRQWAAADLDETGMRDLLVAVGQVRRGR